MKISFKTSEDKLKCEIFLNEMYIGYVYLDVWKQKWLMKPNFNLTYNFTGTKNDKFDSSYEAGIGLSEMLTYLKARV